MQTAPSVDPVALTQDLIRCASVTPREAGVLSRLEAVLTPMGFRCERMTFGEGAERVENLYARIGTTAPLFCFAGHVDVVPPGDSGQWRHDPFAAIVEEGVLYGRGASDMKSAIAAFVAAVGEHLSRHGLAFGSIGLLITGDEEGPAVNGTVQMLERLATRGEKIDACLVGEPTNPNVLGEMAKIGRRGSLNGNVEVVGRQGHVAYPHLAANPLPRLIAIAEALIAFELDTGTEHFPPSNLELTAMDSDAGAENVIPASARLRFNIRFNDLHRGDALAERLRATIEAANERAGGGEIRLHIRVSGEAFLTPPGALSTMLVEAVETVTGRRPDLSTTGGTSDARFIATHAPVIEFGGVGATMHAIDERQALDDIRHLAAIYREMLARYFASVPRSGP